MTDIVKVINGLEGCLAPAHKGWPYKPNIMEAGCEWYDCPYSSNCEDILFDALELLKAQEPVSPTIKQEMDNICSCIDNVAYCGRCGARIGRLKQNYCSECGQAVKWK